MTQKILAKLSKQEGIKALGSVKAGSLKSGTVFMVEFEDQKRDALWFSPGEDYKYSFGGVRHVTLDDAKIHAIELAQYRDGIVAIYRLEAQ